MKFVCTVCGYIYEGDAPPAECPVCHVKSDKFKPVEGEIKLAAEHELGIYAKIRLVEPMSITRSEGKAKRVIDNRVI